MTENEKRRLALNWKPWQQLIQPRGVTAAMLVAYLVAAWGGLSVFWEGAPRLAEVWSLGYERFWATTLVLGGLLGAAATPRGLWFVERPALVLCSVGLVAYCATVLHLHVHNADGNQQLTLAVALLALLLMITRWVRIRWAAMDPAK